jgi:hypothetical protein
MELSIVLLSTLFSYFFFLGSKYYPQYLDFNMCPSLRIIDQISHH